MSNLDTGNVLGIFAFLVSIGGVIYTAINHKRFRLKCCGKDIDVSVDVEDTTKKPGESVDATKSGERPVATAPILLATPTKQTIQVSQKQNDEDEEDEEEDEEEEEYVDRRKQNIKENERNEALKAQYALRVANARKYNQNRRVAPLPPLILFFMILTRQLFLLNQV